METLPSSAYIAAGAIFTAFISAVVAFVTLIISKESKISEFRMNWINELRMHIGENLAQYSAIATTWDYIHSLNTHQDKKSLANEFIEKTNENYKIAHDSYTKVILMLDPKNHAELIAVIKKIDSICEVFDSDYNKAKADESVYDQWYDANAEAIELTAAVLDKEWDRVRQGEPAYRRTKKTGVGILIISFISLLILIAFYSV